MGKQAIISQSYDGTFYVITLGVNGASDPLETVCVKSWSLATTVMHMWFNGKRYMLIKEMVEAVEGKHA